MGDRPWYKRYGGDFVMGTMNLTLEEKGAYSLCLDLIYDRGSPIPDDDRWLSGVCGVSVRKWRALRERLLELSKLVAVDGCLTNFRAEKEIENAAKTSRKHAENGAKGGRARVENEADNNKNNDLDQATLEPRARVLPEPEPDKEEEPKGPSSLAGVPPPKKNRLRARRCPEVWSPSQRALEIAASLSFTPGEIERELAKFRDHEFQAPKSDWDATFCNWIRNAAERKPRERPHHHNDQTSSPDPRRANTESRRGVWAELIAERDGISAAPNPDAGPERGGPGDVSGYPRLAFAGDGG